jgi:hypothetical protein
MAAPFRTLLLSLAFVATHAAGQVDSNLQTLLNALMQGTEVALFTPLADGTVQVTSFRVPGQRSAAEAAALIQRARLNLTNLGVATPTGEQLATALIGGPVDVPSGRTSMVGVLPAGTTGTQLRSQVVTAGGLPQAVAVSPAGVASPGNAAAGGTASSGASVLSGPLAGMTVAQQTQALELANAQLAALGITQPTPQQVTTMLQGGTLVTPAGAGVTVPGLISGRATQAPIVTPTPTR